MMKNYFLRLTRNYDDSDVFMTSFWHHQKYFFLGKTKSLLGATCLSLHNYDFDDSVASNLHAQATATVFVRFAPHNGMGIGGRGKMEVRYG